jgi:hypothetical protein
MKNTMSDKEFRKNVKESLMRNPEHINACIQQGYITLSDALEILTSKTNKMSNKCDTCKVRIKEECKHSSYYKQKSTTMKNLITIEGKEFELPDELVNKIKEELNKPKKITFKNVQDFVYSNYTNVSLTVTSTKQAHKLEAINMLMNTAKYLNGDWKNDGGFEIKDDWRYTYNIGREGLFIDNNLNIKSFVYFKTKELAQQALEILGEETIKLALSTDW